MILKYHSYRVVFLADVFLRDIYVCRSDRCEMTVCELDIERAFLNPGGDL